MSPHSKRAMRVLHCPTNIGGQMWEYVQGLRGLGVQATALTFARHPFDYQDDICLDLHAEPSIWKRRATLVRNFASMVRQYDIIHFHFGGTLLPRYLDLPLLRLMGKKMVMNYWGSEVRLESIAAKHNPFYKAAQIYLGNDNKKIADMKRVSRFVKVAAVADYELHSYVAPFFERTVIVQQAIDVRRIRPCYPDPTNARPMVVHAPSRRDIKGTSFIEKVIDRLRNRYNFDFLCLNQAKHHEVMGAFGKADIVVDQLLLGAYGVASVEAMALGKPVICYIRDDLVSKYPENLPIVSANPDTIEEKLEALLTDPKLRLELGMRSRAFAERYHDSKVVAEKLVSLYKSL